MGINWGLSMLVIKRIIEVLAAYVVHHNPIYRYYLLTLSDIPLIIPFTISSIFKNISMLYARVSIIKGTFLEQQSWFGCSWSRELEFQRKGNIIKV